MYRSGSAATAVAARAASRGVSVLRGAGVGAVAGAAVSVEALDLARMCLSGYSVAGAMERRAAPARAAGAERNRADAVGVESPTSHWRQLGSAGREDGDGSGDDVEAPLLSRGSPR